MTRATWRQRWFQIHKWIGLVLAMVIVPLTLSGAALVWHDALDRLVNPARYAVTGATLLAPDAYVQAARRALMPGDRIALLTVPDGRRPVTLAAVPATGGPRLRRIVYLDPPSARILDVARSDAGLVRFLHGLHGSLRLPGIGRQIVGWIGVAMLLSSLTGLWLWWPMVGRWTRGLRFRRHRNLDTNLHHMMGFWIALPLFVLSATGVWISFPGVFGGGQRGGPGGGGRAAPALPLEAPAQPLATVMARATEVQRGRLATIAWPTTRSPDWTVTLAGGRTVKVADDGGIAVAAPTRTPGGTALLIRHIHDGEGMGLVWQLVIFAGGLLPAGLAVTGVIMWWRARGWRARLNR